MMISDKYITVQLPPQKDYIADVSSTGPSLQRSGELWITSSLDTEWRTCAIHGKILV